MSEYHPPVNQCKAKSKRTGERCQRPCVTGRDVCYHHGGATPRGFALPQTKTGRWSKDLPTRLAARLNEVETDEDLLSLKQDIRLLDALLQDDLTRLESGESAETWQMMRKAVDKLDKGIAAEQYGDVHIALQEMRDIVDKRILHYATESEVRSKLEQRRKLVEAQVKMQYQEGQAITIDQAMMIIASLTDILRTNIHDIPTLSRIQNDIQKLITIEAG